MEKYQHENRCLENGSHARVDMNLALCAINGVTAAETRYALLMPPSGGHGNRISLFIRTRIASCARHGDQHCRGVNDVCGKGPHRADM